MTPVRCARTGQRSRPLSRRRLFASPPPTCGRPQVGGLAHALLKFGQCRGAAQTTRIAPTRCGPVRNQEPSGHTFSREHGETVDAARHVAAHQNAPSSFVDRSTKSLKLLLRVSSFRQQIIVLTSLRVRTIWCGCRVCAGRRAKIFKPKMDSLLPMTSAFRFRRFWKTPPHCWRANTVPI